MVLTCAIGIPVWRRRFVLRSSIVKIGEDLGFVSQLLNGMDVIGMRFLRFILGIHESNSIHVAELSRAEVRMKYGLIPG
jgi:hypothetical protein